MFRRLSCLSQKNEERLNQVYRAIFGVSLPILTVLLLTTMGIKAVALGIGHYVVYSLPQPLIRYNNGFDALSIWDANDERLIAEFGYSLDTSHRRFIAKPPLFALATRAWMLSTGFTASASIFVVHSISVFFCLLWIYRFACLVLDSTIALKIALLFPFSLTGTGFIFILSYHEPLGIALVMAIFYYLAKRNSFWVSLLTSLLVLSRSQAIGIILILLMVSAYDGWIAYNNYRFVSDGNRRQVLLKSFAQSSSSFLAFCATPLLAFLIWQTVASLASGWAFAPLYAQRFHAHGFNLANPYELIRPFIELLNPTMNPFWIPFHLVSGLTVIVAIVHIGYLIWVSPKHRNLIPSTAYIVFMFVTMAFVGTYGMPRILHASIFPFAWILMTHKVGQVYGHIHEIIFNIVFVAASIIMTGILLYGMYIESFGYFP